jgi:hypothetical protein
MIFPGDGRRRGKDLRARTLQAKKEVFG